MPKIFLSFCVLTLSILIGLFVNVPLSTSDELDDITKQINDLTQALNQSVAATKPLESQLTSMQNQISGIRNKVSSIDTDLTAKKKAIEKGYEDLAAKQAMLNKTVRNYYIKSYYNNPLLILVSAADAQQLTQTLAYQRATTDQDKTIITNIALSLSSLEEKERVLKSEQSRLLSLKASLDEQSKKLDEVITGAKAYQKEVSGKLAALSAKQSEILNARSGGFTATIGDSDLADDYT